MSTKKAERRPLSRANLVILAVLALGLVAALVLGLWPQAAGIGLVLTLGMLSVWYGRRVNATDVNRVDAIEYLDERDRTIARDGFAAVGATALVLTTVEYVAVSVTVPHWIWFPAGQLLVLTIVWGVANRIAARRH